MKRIKAGVVIEISDQVWRDLPESEKAKFEPLSGDAVEDALTIERITESSKKKQDVIPVESEPDKVTEAVTTLMNTLNISEEKARKIIENATKDKSDDLQIEKITPTGGIDESKIIEIKNEDVAEFPVDEIPGVKVVEIKKPEQSQKSRPGRKSSKK